MTYYHTCKFDQVVRAGCTCVVVVQQSEEEGAQHTSFGGPHVQHKGAGGVAADLNCPWSLPPKVGWCSLS